MTSYRVPLQQHIGQLVYDFVFTLLISDASLAGRRRIARHTNPVSATPGAFTCRHDLFFPPLTAHDVSKSKH